MGQKLPSLSMLVLKALARNKRKGKENNSDVKSFTLMTLMVQYCLELLWWKVIRYDEKCYDASRIVRTVHIINNVKKLSFGSKNI